MLATRMRTTFAVFVAAIFVSMASTPAARSSPIQATYSTTATIGTTGITGTPDVSFQGITAGTLTTGQPFNLGQFVMTQTSGEQAPVYWMTPFQITVNVSTVGGNPSLLPGSVPAGEIHPSVPTASGDPPLAGRTPVTLNGFLETETGSGHSLVRAYLVSTNPAAGADMPPPQAFGHWTSENGSSSYWLYPTSTAISLDPISPSPGRFEAQGQLDAYNTPEPTALATLVVATMGLIVKHRLGRGKRQKLVSSSRDWGA